MMNIKEKSRISDTSFNTKQFGAVMVEFVIVSLFVLVSLFTLVPFLGKFIDTKHKAHQAAHYAAWERTVWFAPGSTMVQLSPVKAIKSHDGIGYEIQARVLAGAEEPVHSEQRTGQANVELDAMQYFVNRNQNGSYQSLLKTANGNQQPGYVEGLTLSESAISGKANGIINAIVKAGGSIGQFDLNTKGLDTSQVMLDVYEPTWFTEFFDVDIKFNSQYTLLTDAWNAGGSEHNKNLVKGLLPTQLFNWEAFNKARRLLSIVPVAHEIHPESLKFGHVNVDEVPAIRLRN